MEVREQVFPAPATSSEFEAPVPTWRNVINGARSVRLVNDDATRTIDVSFGSDGILRIVPLDKASTPEKIFVGREA